MNPIPGKQIYSDPESPASSERMPRSEYDRMQDHIYRNEYIPVLGFLAEEATEESDRLMELRETYRLLREYYAKGAEDPDRRNYTADIGRQLVAILNRRREEEMRQADPTNFWNTTKETLRIRGLEGEQALVEVAREVGRRPDRDEVYYHLVEDLFDLIWTGNGLTEPQEKALRVLIEDVSQPNTGRVVVSALMVGGLLYFDPRKVRLLFEASLQVDSPMVQGAAVPALLLVARMQQRLIEATLPTLQEEIRREVQHNKALSSAILLATLELHNSYCTEEDHKLFTEQILPKIQDLMSSMGQLPGANLAEQMENLQKKMMEDQDPGNLEGILGDFMGKLTRADYMEHDLEYHSVSIMGQGPFFRKPVNWFIPFDEGHPALDLERVAAMSGMSSMVFQQREIISTDLYFYATQLDWAQIRRQLQQMGAPMDEAPRLARAKDLRSRMRDFIFGAYRFYTLFSHKESFANIFALKPYVPDGAVTQLPHLFTEEEYDRLAQRLTKQRHYTNAGYTYARLIQEYGVESAQSWRILSVANIKAHRDRDALNALDRAIALEGPTAATIKSKAKLMRESKTNAGVIEMIRKETESMELTQREDYDLSRYLLELMLEDGLYETAVPVAYKVDYLAEEVGASEGTRRTLCKVLLLAGRAEEALDHLETLDEADGLAGVILLAAGRQRDGLHRLQKWYDRTDRDTTRLERLLDSLSRYDFPTWERGLIYDVIVSHTLS